MHPVIRLLVSRYPGVLHVADNVLLGLGRNTKDQDCTAEREGSLRWTRGGTGG